MPHTEDLHGLGHLATAHLGQVAQDLGIVHELGVQDVAALATGA